MPYALRLIDMQGALFFLGILMSVAALQTAGILTSLSKALDSVITDETLLAGIIGAASAVIDNVPLVAAAMGMYDLTAHPADSPFWDLITFCSGTGGSMLIIGSAAGIAYMSFEKSANFGWYLKNITPGAVAGYLAGIATLSAQVKLAGVGKVVAAGSAVVGTGLMAHAVTVSQGAGLL